MPAILMCITADSLNSLPLCRAYLFHEMEKRDSKGRKAMDNAECGFFFLKKKQKPKRRERKANDASKLFIKGKQGIDLPLLRRSPYHTPFPWHSALSLSLALRGHVQGNGTAASLPGCLARPMRVHRGADGCRRRQCADHDVPVLLRQHHGGLPFRAPARVRPRGAPRPALLHQRRAHAAPPLGLVPRPRRRLRIRRPHPARPGHVRLPRARPYPGRPGQRLRPRAVAGAVPGARPGQRVPPPRLPRHLAALPGLPRPASPLPERVRDGVRGLLQLPRVGRLLRQRRPAPVGRHVRLRRGGATRVLRGALGRHPGGERDPARVRGVQQRVQPRARARGGGSRRVGVRDPGVVGAARGEPRVLRRVPRHGRGVRPRHGEPRRPVPLRGLELHLQLRLLDRSCAVRRRRPFPSRRRGASLGRPRLRICVTVVVRIGITPVMVAPHV